MRPSDIPTSFIPSTPPRFDKADTDELQAPTFILAQNEHIPSMRPHPAERSWPWVRGYEILSLIGTGGMGIVYKARHRELNRIVALKMLRGAAVSDPEFRTRFRTEAEAVAQLQHPNIIQVFEVGTVEPTGGDYEPSPFIALEYVDGASLARYTSSPQRPQFAAGIVETLARAAHAAHRVGVVHRDLKPANVLLTHDGEPKIADFGVAKQIGHERDESGRFATQAGIAVGTPEYMAPEQVAGEVATPAIDVYALGVILYELLTARVPFQGHNPADTMYLVRLQEPVPPRRLQPGLPRDLETICLKCLAKTPARRYESAEALAEDLARWADGRAIRARAVGRCGRTVRWARRNPTISLLSAAVVLVAVAGFAGVLVNWREARRQADAANASASRADERALSERWERYRADIIAASSALQVHDVGAARRALKSAPEEHRNWEWRFFSHQLDNSSDMLGGEGSGMKWELLSQNGTATVAVADDGEVGFWDLANRRVFAAITVPADIGRSKISPDGRSLAYLPPAPANDALVLCDVSTGLRRAVLGGHQTPIIGSAFSPDSSLLISGSRDGFVRIWETATGTLRTAFRAHLEGIGTPAISSDNRILATPGVKDRTLRLWDAATGKRLACFEGHSWNVDYAAFNPSGDRVLAVAGYPANKLWLWDVDSGTLVAEMSGHTNQIRDYAFSPDGKRIATASLDRTIRLWDGRTGKFINSLRGHSGWISSIAFSPDGTTFASASDDRTVRLWDAAVGTELAVLHGHTAEVFKVGFTADGTRIASLSRDRTLRLWDASKIQVGNVFRGHAKFVYGVAFHPDSQRVASTSWDGTVRIWNATSGKQLALFEYPKDSIVSSVAIHPDGKLFATVARDDAVRLWDLDSGKEVHRWRAQTDSWQDTRLNFSPRGDLLACGGKDGILQLWDVSSRAEVASLPLHRGAIRDVAFSPDGRWLASAGEMYDRKICIVDVARRELVRVLEGHTDGIYALAFNGKGTLLASGSQDQTVRLWNTENWQNAGVMTTGTNVYSLAFPKDDTRLAGGCADNSIRFWDVATQQEVAELRGHSDYVHSIAFSPDGTRMVSGSGDFTVRIWDTISSQERGK